MLKPSIVTALAAAVGFVSVLVYQVSASSAAGSLQLPLAASVVAAQPEKNGTVAVEFVIEQCQPAARVADLSAFVREPVAKLELPKQAAPVAAPVASTVVPAGKRPSASLAVNDHGVVHLSPSIIYIP